MLKNMAKIIGIIVGVMFVVVGVLKKQAKKTTYKAETMEPIDVRKMGFYERHIKRVLDIICASCAVICFSPLYLIIAILVRIKLGSPVLFMQDRPGIIDRDGKETVFKMYKFRTMTNERDEDGNLFPDEIRLTKFGKWLRKTSLDELPEVFNILNGTMTVIGPRPQLVKDLVYMNNIQRRRHTAKPGLSGLAQTNGRNAISWDEKFKWDLIYVNEIGFRKDFKIIIDTIKKAFVNQEGITQENMATAEDLAEYLLRTNQIDVVKYEEKKRVFEEIIKFK